MTRPHRNLEEMLEEDPDKFWEEFHRTEDVEMRNLLVEKYLPLVHYHAERLGAKLHDKLDIEDLKQEGIFGLMQALEKFDPSRGYKFATYCAMRIRGAILDDLRSNDWVPRLIRQRSNQLEKAFKELEDQLGRPPHDHEMADHLEMDLEDYHELAREASAASIISMQCQPGGDSEDNNSPRADLMRDRSTPDPSSKVVKKDLILAMLKELDLKEKRLIQMYYFDELTMREIGAAMDISESRVSQIHSSIINRLRFKFGKDVRGLAA